MDVKAHIPVARVTVGAMVALLREYPSGSIVKVAGSGERSFDDPVLIVIPGRIIICQADDAPRVSVVLSERGMT
jgi:hypothetical protein